MRAPLAVGPQRKERASVQHRMRIGGHPAVAVDGAPFGDGGSLARRVRHLAEGECAGGEVNDHRRLLHRGERDRQRVGPQHLFGAHWFSGSKREAQRAVDLGCTSLSMQRCCETSVTTRPWQCSRNTVSSLKQMVRLPGQAAGLRPRRMQAAVGALARIRGLAADRTAALLGASEPE